MESERTENIEFRHSSTSRKLLPLQSPLLDLPIPVTELILERLPLPDYIRFGSVCKKCHSIQKYHRIRHSPLPPPIQKSFPWLIRNTNNETLACYSPLEQKYFTLSMPKSVIRVRNNELAYYSPLDQQYFSHSINSLIPTVPIFFASALSLGWFFLVGYKISLFNPVSKSQIDLDPLITHLSAETKGVLSGSPFSPDSVLLILDCRHYKALFYWFGRKQWTSLDLPIEFNSRVYFFADCVYCNGKFYCIVKRFLVIDLGLTTPVADELNMDCSQLPSKEYDLDQTLVESNGEVLLVDVIYHRNYKTIKVFKAEFSKMMWVRLKNVGDRALFVTSKGSFSLSASDVGCKSNCVYFLDVGHRFVKARGIWTVFDIGTKLWSDGPPFPCKENKNQSAGCFENWILPSFDYNV